MFELDDKAAFITGGAGGIGFALAQVFAEAGMRVAIADLRADAAEVAAEAIRRRGAIAIAIRLDVTSLDDWTRAADRAESAIGPISLLCNNAGSAGAEAIVQVEPLDRLLPEEWSFLVGVNFTALYYGIRTFVPRFKARGGPAHVCNTVSMAGLMPQFAGLPGAYVATKFGAAGLTEQLRLELAADAPQIGVSMLAPGTVRTQIRKVASEVAPHGRSVIPPGHVDGFAPTMERAMDPLAVARFARDAIRRGDFYIFTHPEYRKLADHYHARIAGAWRDSADASHADALPDPT